MLLRFWSGVRDIALVTRCKMISLFRNLPAGGGGGGGGGVILTNFSAVHMVISLCN